jgi:hypothetical protein
MNRLKDSKGKCEKTAEIIEKPFDARVEGFRHKTMGYVACMHFLFKGNIVLFG